MDAAIFSASMIVGMFVLPAMMVGMIEASATLSPLIHAALRRLDDRHLVAGSRPMRHVPTR